MSDLKSLLLRINSVNSTKKITRVMQMIATSKLRQAQIALTDARLYRERVYTMFEKVAKLDESSVSEKKVSIVIASDKGLCGGYNSSVFKLFKRSHPSEAYYFCGTKAVPIVRSLDKAKLMGSELSFKDVLGLVTEIALEYPNSKIEIIYTKFHNAMQMSPEVFSIISFSGYSSYENDTMKFEPYASDMMQTLYNRYVAACLYCCLKEAKVSENMSRMLAMDGATKNAQDVVDALRRHYNKLRQEKITKELIEVVSGAEVV